MNVKTSKRNNFYTPVQRFAVRVLFIVWLLAIRSPPSALAVLPGSAKMAVGILALFGGGVSLFKIPDPEDPEARRQLQGLAEDLAPSGANHSLLKAEDAAGPAPGLFTEEFCTSYFQEQKIDDFWSEIIQDLKKGEGTSGFRPLFVDLGFKYLSAKSDNDTEFTQQLIGCLANFNELSALYLVNGDIGYLPPNIAMLSHLTYLLLFRNEITKLPPKITELPLEWIDLSLNPICCKPDKVLQQLQQNASLTVYCKIVDETCRPPAEAPDPSEMIDPYKLVPDPLPVSEIFEEDLVPKDIGSPYPRRQVPQTGIIYGSRRA